MKSVLIFFGFVGGYALFSYGVFNVIYYGGAYMATLPTYAPVVWVGGWCGALLGGAYLAGNYEEKKDKD